MKDLILVVLFSVPAIICRRLIVGGNEISIEEAPYTVALITNGVYHCTGSLISKNFTISAGHCIVMKRKYTIRVGSEDRNTNGLVINVEEIFVHPEYHESEGSKHPIIIDYDFALLRLSNVKEFPKSVQFVALPHKNDELKVGEMMQIAGWGITYSKHEKSQYLRGAFVPIYDFDECKRSYEAEFYLMTERMVCAGYKEGGIDTCQGKVLSKFKNN